MGIFGKRKNKGHYNILTGDYVPSFLPSFGMGLHTFVTTDYRMNKPEEIRSFYEETEEKLSEIMATCDRHSAGNECDCYIDSATEHNWALHQAEVAEHEAQIARIRSAIQMRKEDLDRIIGPLQDWADMLFRMYNRWGAAHGFKVSTLDYQDGDEAGLKSASIMVEGPNAYGLLKGENGVHRLVRVSPFDSQSRRQTSFASLEVMPELDDSIQVEIRPEDIEMQVYRSSGAGGQHINKTSSAVRLIHKPTGIVVSCQTERSQFQNRDTAMKMLASKLYQIKEQEHLDKISDIKGVQNEIAWGHQIRSYVFMPYTMVKDHRTGYENGNVQAVMDGDLDGFINAYLKAASRGELQDT